MTFSLLYKKYKLVIVSNLKKFTQLKLVCALRSKRFLFLYQWGSPFAPIVICKFRSSEVWKIWFFQKLWFEVKLNNLLFLGRKLCYRRFLRPWKLRRRIPSLLYIVSGWSLVFLPSYYWIMKSCIDIFLSFISFVFWESFYNG